MGSVAYLEPVYSTDFARSNIIELKSLSKNFGELKVLENIDFAIRAGEIFAIIGTSGSGKSTFLNIISGLLEQDSGSFRISGKASGQFSGWKRLAYMFQEDRLLPWRTVRDNVAFGLENTSLGKQAKKARIDEVIDLVGLHEFADYWPHQISGGMRSRVALARSLVIEPEVLLMDEPFSKLDAQTRSQMHGELLRLHDLTGMTVVFVTHDVEEAAVLADRVAVFSSRPGRVKEIVDVNLDRPRLLTDAHLSEQIRTLRKKI